MTTTIRGEVAHVRAEDFRHRAACRDVDPELFFPVAECGPEHDAQVAVAKAVCGGCPVRARCLAWALSVLPYGVAGGMSEQERRLERSRGRGPGGGGGAPQRPAGGSRAEVAAAGRAAIRAGLGPREAAREFGVTERTAARWAAGVAARTGVEGSSGVGRPGDGFLAGHSRRADLSESRTGQERSR